MDDKGEKLSSSTTLRGVRVLEIGARNTMYAGQLLADMGAEVIIVEPVGGAVTRRMPPFLDGRPGLDRGITWRSLNGGKRSLTLDTESRDGQHLLSQLLENADVVIAEPEQPWRQSIDISPDVILCEISDFDVAGTKAKYAANDLTVMAASGPPAVTGDLDREPLLFPVPQSIMEAGAEAVVGILAALSARRRDGHGQTVSTSARFAAMSAAFRQPLRMPNGLPDSARTGQGAIPARVGRVDVQAIYSCPDGHVECYVNPLRKGFATRVQALARCLVDKGHLDERLAETDWHSYSVSVNSEGGDGELFREFMDAMIEFCGQTTKFEIAECSRKYGFMAAPVLTVEEVAGCEQYDVRNAWVTVHDELVEQPIRVPSFLATLDGSPDLRVGPPMLSQDTVNILSEILGLADREISALFSQGVI